MELERLLRPLSQGILKGESGLFLTNVLMLWGGGHIDRHVRRRVIVPSDLARSFGVICEHYQNSKWRSLKKRAIFDLLFIFLVTREKTQKFLQHIISLTYIHIFCSPD